MSPVEIFFFVFIFIFIFISIHTPIAPAFVRVTCASMRNATNPHSTYT